MLEEEEDEEVEVSISQISRRVEVEKFSISRLLGDRDKQRATVGD